MSHSGADFKAERFVEAVTTKSLYFAAARQFEDPFEGAVAVQPHDWPEDPRYDRLEGAEGAFEQLRRLTKVSCWHRADYESDAMWKLYAGARKGVAVRTTRGRLAASLLAFRLQPHHGEEEPWWGPVRYVDLRKERLRASMEQRFFYKHRAFEWEKEFRVAISLRSAEMFVPDIPEHGIRVSFDPRILVESLFIGPSLNRAEREAVVEACTQTGANVKPTVSTLLGKPRYT